MQNISDLIGDAQFGKGTCECMDCNKEFDMCFERLSQEEIEITNGAMAKRGDDYLFKCQECHELNNGWGLDCEVYSRCVGYYRPVSNWNAGKQAEYKIRKTQTEKMPKSL